MNTHQPTKKPISHFEENDFDLIARIEQEFNISYTDNADDNLNEWMITENELGIKTYMEGELWRRPYHEVSKRVVAHWEQISILQRPATEADLAYEKSYNELEAVDETNFKIKNQRLMLTYKTHLLKDAFIAWLTQAVSGQCKAIKFIRCAHESGDKSHPYLHTHVVIDFGKGFQTSAVRFFDYEGIHPNIKKIFNDKHFRNSQRYLAKEDVENADLKEIKCSLAEEIWSCTTKLEAIMNCSRASDVLGISMLYDMKPVEWMGGNSCCIENVDQMYPWQRDLFNYTLSEPDTRTVYWVYDHEGHNGKNEIIKYCCYTFNPMKYIWIPCQGKVSDIMNVLCMEIKKGWRGDTIFINMARSATFSSDMPQVYSLIENLKDGMISTTKYNGFRLDGCPKFHVIVLSNIAPERHRLTADRWRIVALHKKEAHDMMQHNVATGTYNPSGI